MARESNKDTKENTSKEAWKRCEKQRNGGREDRGRGGLIKSSKCDEEQIRPHMI